MSRLATREFERILIIKPSSMGDVIHALPVLSGLRRRYPAARISWLLSTACMELLAGHDELDERIPFDRKRYGRIARSAAATAAFAGFLDHLRGRAFDLVIDLQGLFRSGFIAMATGARTRIGLSDARELARVFYTDRIPIDTIEEHAIDRNYRVSRLLGFEDVPVGFRLPVSAEERHDVRQLLTARGVDPTRYATVFASARWETKVWPAEHFAATADGLWAEYGLRSVLMGAPGDAPIGDAIAARAKSEPLRLFDVSLRQMVALIDGAALVVGNESGPIHVAVALDRPVVTLIGPTSPVRTGPYRRPDSVVRRELDCAPCYLRRYDQCPHAHTCLQDLPADTVLAACRRLLGADRGSLDATSAPAPTK